jgi:Tol biopolymer transport system component
MRVRDGWAQPLTIIPGADQEPAWSPDGRWIAYVTDHLGNTDIYRVPAKGGTAQRLTTDPGHDDAPAWSPDGAQIAFAATRENAALLAASGGSLRFANYDIYVMNANGSDRVRLTTDPANDAQPVWSPDGTWIAFVSDRDGDKNIYAMRADGSDLRQLTTHRGIDESPAWSPDGAWIAFASDRDGDRNIYAMHPDGSDPRALTHTPDLDKTPVWSYPVRGVYRAALAAATGVGLVAYALAAPLRAQVSLSRQGRRKPSP